MKICAYCIADVLNHPNRYRVEDNGVGDRAFLAAAIELHATEDPDRPRIIDTHAAGGRDWGFGAVLPLRAVTTLNGVSCCVLCAAARTPPRPY
ncbi:hypothetical protein [Kitasatospora sp. NPDC057198]|uniref:hypothetical protein n=1 Tax=Kitasatospora sp. NPDC057198 TaxID=3346046 RepID=UPI0036411E97